MLYFNNDVGIQLEVCLSVRASHSLGSHKCMHAKHTVPTTRQGDSRQDSADWEGLRLYLHSTHQLAAWSRISATLMGLSFIVKTLERQWTLNGL